MAKITSGRTNEDRKAIERNWPFDSPRCDCGKKLTRYEVGICAECLSTGRTRPDA